MSADAMTAALFDPTPTPAAEEPLRRVEPPAEALDERRFLLAAAATFDAWLAAWTAAGLDPEGLVADLRVALTQALLAAQRRAEGGQAA